MKLSSDSDDWIDETLPPPEHMPAIKKSKHRLAPLPWNLDSTIKRFGHGRVIERKPGGMADVHIFRVYHSDFTIAIKTHKAETFNSPRAFDEIIEEAKKWVSLGKHTNIVQAYMVGAFRKKPAIFLEYVDGGDLSQYFGKLSITEIIDYAIQFCDGMDYSHKRTGIVHGDIKPSNILLSSQEILKVTDFGISYFMVEEGDKPGLHVGSPQFRGGTDFYIAPEAYPVDTQDKHGYFSATKGATMCSDIFSFGVTLYEVLTCTKPFNDIDEVYELNPPPNPASKEPDVPHQLDSLVMRCLEKDPSKRYQSFGELMQVLIEIYNSLPKEQKQFGEEYTVRGKEEQDNGYALYSMAELLSSLKRYREAINYIERSLVIDSKSAEAWYGIGVCHSHLEEWEQAKQCFGQSLTIEPKYAEVWHGKGYSHTKLEEWEPAKQCYAKALAIEPKNAEAWHGKGFCHSYLEEWEPAMQCYEKALAIKPKDADAWFNKGNCHSHLEEWEQAMQCYEQALAIKPKYAAAWHGKGFCHSYLEEWEQAMQCYAKALAIEPKNAEAWFNKGICHSHLEEWEQAKQCFGQVLVIKPKNAEAWYGIGVCHSHLEEWEPAMQCYEKTLAIKPKDADAWFKKGNCHSHLEEWEQAMQCYEQALAIKPKYAAAWHGKGFCHSYLEEWEQAMQCYAKALAIEPKNAEAWFNKGICHSHLEEWEQAKQCYEQALAIDPGFSGRWYGRMK